METTSKSVLKRLKIQRGKWRIVRPEGKCYYVITNDVDIVDFVHRDELADYGINESDFKKEE